jgi:hypothetical protein
VCVIVAIMLYLFSYDVCLLFVVCMPFMCLCVHCYSFTLKKTFYEREKNFLFHIYRKKIEKVGF